MSNNYQGKIGFTATITVKDHPEMDPQHIQSNLQDYQVAAPRTPTVAIGEVWGNGIIPFTSVAPSLPETGHALSAAFLSPDGKIKDLFQVVSAKFHLNNGKEYDVTDQITNDNSGTVTADPVRTDFLRNYDRSGYVNFTLILIDKLTKEQITIQSQKMQEFLTDLLVCQDDVLVEMFLRKIAHTAQISLETVLRTFSQLKKKQKT